MDGTRVDRLPAAEPLARSGDPSRTVVPFDRPDRHAVAPPELLSLDARAVAAAERFGLPSPAQLADAAIVSFDIFDTLIVRPFQEPTGLFRLVEWHLRRQHAAAAEGWAEARIAAEDELRRAAWAEGQRPEIQFEELRLPLAQRFGVAIAARGLELELALELETCRPHPVVRTFFDAAIEAGRRVVLMSDIYLDRNTIERMLARCGYRGFERLFLSSQEGTSKHHGGLYRVMLDAMGVKPEQVLHVGDNRVADGERARKAGLRSVVIPRMIDFVPRSPVSRRLKKRLLPTDSGSRFWEGVASGVYALRCARGDGFDGDTPADKLRRFGYFVGGPAIHGFARFVVDRCQERDLRNVWFLARDGLIVMDAIDRLGIAPPRTRLQYVQASRRCMNVAAIEAASGDDLDFLCSGTTRLRPAQYVTRVGLDPATPEITAALARRFGDGTKVVTSAEDFARLRALFVDIERHLLARVESERAVLIRYLETLGVTDSEVGLVDIGWQGSMQKALFRLLDRHTSFDGKLFGIYFGTFDHALADTARQSHCGYMFDRGRPMQVQREFRECVELIELIFAPPEPGVVHLVERNGSIEPVVHKYEDEVERFKVCALLREGIRAWLDDIRNAGLHLAPAPIEDYARAALTCVLQHPTADEVGLFGDIPHAEGFYGGYLRPLVQKAPAGFRPMALWRAFNQAFWKQGFRAQLSRPQRLALKIARRMHGL